MIQNVVRVQCCASKHAWYCYDEVIHYIERVRRIQEVLSKHPLSVKRVSEIIKPI